MEFKSEFASLEMNGVHDLAKERKENGWRYVQILAVNNDSSVDLVYSYMKDGLLENYVVSDVPYRSVLESITDLYLEAFVCENEIHDLFGIGFNNLAIDFLGNFYKVANETPMTIITPEQAAARKKAAQAAEKKTKDPVDDDPKKPSSQDKEDLEAKLANMDPEKAAKVRAAMEAKAKKEASKKQDDLEAKLAGMDPDKAAKVRAAMEAKAKKAARAKDQDGGSEEQKAEVN